LKINQISSELNLDYLGNPDIEILSISSPEFPLPNTLVFLSKKKKFDSDMSNIVFLVSKDLAPKLPKNFNLLLSDSPKLDFALITNILNNRHNKLSSLGKLDDSSVHVGKNTQISNDCLFGKNVVIEDNVKIGKNSIIFHNVVIHQGVTIGNNVIIESGTIIGSEGFGNALDQQNNWIHINHFGGVLIGDNVSIGANCCIDRGTIEDTVIDKGVIIDNMVHIAHNVRIGENSAIAAKVGIAGSCNIGKRNMIGGMAGIIDHITTSDDVVISATSTVYKNIIEPGVYTGIMPISKHTIWKRIALRITKLDKIVKLLNLKNENHDANEY